MLLGKELSGIALAADLFAPFAAAQAAVACYGLPAFSGDDVIFSPTVFRAESADGVGIHSGTPTDAVSATFVFSRSCRTVPPTRS